MKWTYWKQDLFGLLIGAICIFLAWGEGHCAEPDEVVLQTIAMEASGEPMEGQVLVARTIQNRAINGHYSPVGACLAHKQYSCWNDRVWAFKWLRKHYTGAIRQRAYKAWELAKESSYKGRHYHNTDIKPYWAKGRTPYATIGRHVYYEGIA